MSEERLQEIKDSVEFQYTLAKAKGIDNALLFTNEEEELIEEVERLNKELNNYKFRPKTRFRDIIELRDRINKAIEYLNAECLYNEELGYCDDLWCGQVQELVDILNGVDK